MERQRNTRNLCDTSKKIAASRIAAGTPGRIADLLLVIKGATRVPKMLSRQTRAILEEREPRRSEEFASVTKYAKE